MPSVFADKAHFPDDAALAEALGRAKDSLLKKLEGGDMRSIGRADEVAADVAANPRLFGVLVAGLTHGDPRIRMRSADALEKVTARDPSSLARFKKTLLGVAARTDQQEVRWHLAQIVPRLEMTDAERRAVVETLIRYSEDDSRIVKTFAMQALADLAGPDPRLRPRVLALLERLTTVGSPAMKSRGRKLLARLRR
jgi:hypothetical protein